MRYKKVLVSAAAFVILTGCAYFNPSYKEAPPTKLPENYKETESSAVNQTETPEAAAQDIEFRTLNANSAWWTDFNDPILNELIESAHKNNANLKIVASKVRQAEILYKGSKGAWYPALQLNGGLGVGRTSVQSDARDQFALPPGVLPSPVDQVMQGMADNLEKALLGPRTTVNAQVGLAAGWELDFWGKVYRTVQSAKAGREAVEEAYNGAMITVFAEVAKTYIDIRTLQNRLLYIENNIKNQEEVLQIVEDKYASELVSLADVRKARATVAFSKSFRPQLLAGIGAQINKLAVLCGMESAAMRTLLADVQPVPSGVRYVNTGVPKDILRNRPDIRQAERTLAAAMHQLGVAKAELYPKLSLVGQFSLVSSNEELKNMNLFTGDAVNAAFGVNLSYDVFTGGRKLANMKHKEEQAEEARLNYINTVTAAMAEIDSTITALALESERHGYIQESTENSREAQSAMVVLYRNGLTELMNVLDTEQQVLQQEDMLIQSEGALANYIVQTYRVLGGGWQQHNETETAAADSADDSGRQSADEAAGVPVTAEQEDEYSPEISGPEQTEGEDNI
jgi:multidrug efflux system outer membrane protein